MVCLNNFVRTTCTWSSIYCRVRFASPPSRTSSLGSFSHCFKQSRPNATFSNKHASILKDLDEKRGGKVLDLQKYYGIYLADNDWLSKTKLGLKTKNVALLMGLGIVPVQLIGVTLGMMAYEDAMQKIVLVESAVFIPIVVSIVWTYFYR